MRERSVKAPLTNKQGRYVETKEYIGMLRRALRALVRRVGAEADVEMLKPMVDLRDELDAAIQTAVTQLRTAGYSWAEIGSRLDVSKQAAQQRWGRPQ